MTSLKVGNLTGKLLLVAGDVDDNVNPCMTMQLVEAFINADRPFDLLIMPNRNHDLSYDPYYLHRCSDIWKRIWGEFSRSTNGVSPFFLHFGFFKQSSKAYTGHRK